MGVAKVSSPAPGTLDIGHLLPGPQVVELTEIPPGQPAVPHDPTTSSLAEWAKLVSSLRLGCPDAKPSETVRGHPKRPEPNTARYARMVAWPGLISR